MMLMGRRMYSGRFMGCQGRIFLCPWWRRLHPVWIWHSWRGSLIWRDQMWEWWHPMDNKCVLHKLLILCGWDLYSEGDSWQRYGQMWQCGLLVRRSHERTGFYLFQVCLKYLLWGVLVHQKRFSSIFYGTCSFWWVNKIQGSVVVDDWSGKIRVSILINVNVGIGKPCFRICLYFWQ